MPPSALTKAGDWVSRDDMAAPATSWEHRLVVLGRGNGHDPAAELRPRLTGWRIDSQPSFLAGIADLSRRPANAVLARIAGATQLGEAVAGLREAGGRSTRIVLCCPPQHEPAARAALLFGADDYVLEPLNSAELEAALGIIPAGIPTAAPAATEAAVSVDDLAAFGELLAAFSGKPRELAERAAEMIRKCMGARGAALVVEGARCASGDAVTKPVLSAALTDGSRLLGQVFIGGAERGPYTFADAHKLELLSNLCARVLSAAAHTRSLERLAHTDECTGLHNRRYVRRSLETILSRAAAERFQVTVLLFDIDDFKTYNDRFGHFAGDEILRVTGQLFRRNCREQDIVARYGGDEFCVVFWDPAGPRQAGSKHLGEALVVLDRFQGALRAHQFSALGGDRASERAGSPSHSITISGGLAAYPWDGEDVDALLARADAALLAAKRAGKNRIVVVGEPSGG